MAHRAWISQTSTSSLKSNRRQQGTAPARRHQPSGSRLPRQQPPRTTRASCLFFCGLPRSSDVGYPGVLVWVCLWWCWIRTRMNSEGAGDEEEEIRYARGISNRQRRRERGNLVSRTRPRELFLGWAVSVGLPTRLLGATHARRILLRTPQYFNRPQQDFLPWSQFAPSSTQDNTPRDNVLCFKSSHSSVVPPAD